MKNLQKHDRIAAIRARSSDGIAVIRARIELHYKKFQPCKGPFCSTMGDNMEKKSI